MLARSQKFLLTERLKALRLERSKRILSILKKKSPIILFSDEKYFTVDPVTNSRMSRFITKSNIKDVPEAIRVVPKSKHPSQVLVFGLVASDGQKMPPVFLPTGLRVGARQYLDEILIPHVKPWIEATYPNNNNIVFMQDGAPCHTAKVVQTWLEKNIKHWPKDVWPPSSPDLNPLDFSIWAYVQSRACARQHANLDALKVDIVKAWTDMDEDYIRTTCSSFRPRVEAVIAAEGGYID